VFPLKKRGIVGQVQDDGRSIRNSRGRWRMPKGTWTENAERNLGDKFLRSDRWRIVHLDATPRGTLSVLWHSWYLKTHDPKIYSIPQSGKSHIAVKYGEASIG